MSTGLTSTTFTVPGSDPGTLYVHKKASANGGVIGPNASASVAAITKLATPVVTAGTPTSSSVPFTWPAITGADSYQVQINSGAIVSASTNSYTATGFGSGVVVSAIVRALDSTGTKQTSDFSAPASATTSSGSTTPTTITPATADYFDNGGLSSASAQPGRNSSLNGSRAALSVLAYSTTDPRPTITVGSNMSGFGNDFVAVFNGSSLVGTYQAGTIQLPALSGSAPYALTVINGAQQRSFEQGDIRGTELLTIAAAAGYSLTKATPTKQGKLILWFCNSIGNGAGSSLPQTKAAAALLRAQGFDVVLYGYGSAQGYVMADPANQSAVQAFVTAASVGYSAANIIFLDTTGTNDYHGGQGGAGSSTPTDFANRKAAFMTFLGTLNSSAKQVVITPLTRTDTEAANNLGFTLPQYRAAIVAAIPTAQDGTQAVSSSNISSDGVHPTDAGHVQLANFIAAQLSTQIDPETLSYEDATFVANAKVNLPGGGVVEQAASDSGPYDTGSNSTKKAQVQAGQNFVSDHEFTVVYAAGEHLLCLNRNDLRMYNEQMCFKLYAQASGRVRLFESINGGTQTTVFDDATVGVANNDRFRIRTYIDRFEVYKNDALVTTHARPAGDRPELIPIVLFGAPLGTPPDRIRLRQRGVNLQVF